MKRLELQITKPKTDTILRGGRVFVQFECIGRTLKSGCPDGKRQTGLLQSILMNAKDRPMPVYSDGKGKRCFVELKNVEKLLDADFKLVSSGVQRGVGGNYTTALRFMLIEWALWTQSELATRGRTDA